MTDFPHLSKTILTCLGLAAAASLTACDSHQNLSETLARLKTEPVDASAQPHGDVQDKTLSPQDVQLAVNTAKDLTVNKGGLLDKSLGGLKISIVDPGDQPKPADDSAPLDVRPFGGQGLSAAQVSAAHDLPDVPIARQVAVPQTVMSHTYASLKPVAAQNTTRLVQAGSFSTIEAAQNAWNGLHPHAPGYNASFQKVTTATGATLIRLRVGPVRNDDQAKALCSQLNVRDAWCAKAG